MRRGAIPIVAAALLGCASAVAAQAPCGDTLTVRACYERLRGEAGITPARVESRESGVATPGSDNVSISDFLPRLATALIAPGLDDLELSTAVNVNVSPAVALKLGIAVKRAEVYKPLLDSLPDHKRDAVRTRFEDNFAELDQPRFTLGVTVENQHFGRSVKPHAEALSVLLHEMGTVATTRAGTDAAARFAAFVTSLSTARITPHFVSGNGCDPDTDPTDLRFGCFTQAYQMALVQQMRQAILAEAATRAAMTELITTSGFRYVDDLINNQPQIIAHFEHDAPVEAAGPKQSKWEVRYERGFVNMNGAKQHCGGRALRISCFSNYVNDRIRQEQLRRGDRVWISVAGTYQDDYAAPFLPQDSASFQLPSAWEYEVTGGYGVYIDPGTEGAQGSRLDIALRGVGRKKDGIRETSRWIANLALTQTISDKLAGSLGVMWANKPEFLDDDVRRLGATIGVRFKTDSKEK